jgi:hypothetical protein
MRVGTKVGIVTGLSHETRTIRLVGYGTYLGRLVPPERHEDALLTVEKYRRYLELVEDEYERDVWEQMRAQTDAQVHEQLEKLNTLSICQWRNDCILLDPQYGEQVVWGTEGYWASEAEIRGMVAGYENIEVVDVRVARIEQGADAEQPFLEDDPWRRVLGGEQPGAVASGERPGPERSTPEKSAQEPICVEPTEPVNPLAPFVGLAQELGDERWKNDVVLFRVGTARITVGDIRTLVSSSV